MVRTGVTGRELLCPKGVRCASGKAYGVGRQRQRVPCVSWSMPKWRYMTSWDEKGLNHCSCSYTIHYCLNTSCCDSFILHFFPQGGLICRALLATTPHHNVHTFISLASPQAGQYGGQRVSFYVLKGQFTPKNQKYIAFFLPVLLFIHPQCFGVEFWRHWL